jgi:hypothetical protein
VTTSTSPSRPDHETLPDAYQCASLVGPRQSRLVTAPMPVCGPGQILSARVTELLRTVRAQVRPYQKEPAVQEFVARYDQYLAA